MRVFLFDVYFNKSKWHMRMKFFKTLYQAIAYEDRFNRTNDKIQLKLKEEIHNYEKETNSKV